MVPSSRRPQETPASATPNPQWHPPLSSLYMLCMPSSPSWHKIQKQMEATSIYIELPIYYGTKEITISFHPVGHHKTWKGWAYWSNGTSIPKPPTSSWCETNSQKKKKQTQNKKNIGLTISYRETVEQFPNKCGKWTVVLQYQEATENYMSALQSRPWSMQHALTVSPFYVW